MARLYRRRYLLFVSVVFGLVATVVSLELSKSPKIGFHLDNLMIGPGVFFALSSLLGFRANIWRKAVYFLITVGLYHLVVRSMFMDFYRGTPVTYLIAIFIGGAVLELINFSFVLGVWKRLNLLTFLIVLIIGLLTALAVDFNPRGDSLYYILGCWYLSMASVYYRVLNSEKGSIEG